MQNRPSPKLYAWIAVALLALLALTAVLAFVNLGPFSTPVAFLIAGAKAVLIALYFMHLRYSEKTLWLVAGGMLFWIGIMFSLSLSDYLTRGMLTIPGK
jgi:cytochrome c oxidase subunit 4